MRSMARAQIIMLTHFALSLDRFAILIFERGSMSLLPRDMILPGPDTDLIRDRFGGCHMGSTGLREHAQMWQTSLCGTRHR
jgi:hypothetical protein